MASSRVSRNTILSSSRDDRRQAEAKIRALQQRTNALNEELSRSSNVADSTVHQIEFAFKKITEEFQEQRDQLLRRIHHVKKNLQNSTDELKSVRKSLISAKSFQPSENSSNPLEVQEMNAAIDDIERVLQSISQQLKQYRFKPANGHNLGKKLGKIETIKESLEKEIRVPSRESTVTVMYTKDKVSVHKLYTIDLDLSAQWVVGSIEKRIFVCDREGEVRVFSYSRLRHRQPLITERFHLLNVRLISWFTGSEDYLCAFESDTRLLTIYSHHGALQNRFTLFSEPSMIVHCLDGRKNSILTSSRTKRICFRYELNHRDKEIFSTEKIDLKENISNTPIDPIGISNDEQSRIAIHDVNPKTSDRLVIFEKNQTRTIQLDFVKYADRQITSRIERVLLVPGQPNLLVLVYAPQVDSNNLHEIVIVDVESQPPKVLHRIYEIDGINNLDLTMHGELIYTVTPPANKRILPKLNIYCLIN